MRNVLVLALITLLAATSAGRSSRGFADPQAGPHLEIDADPTNGTRPCDPIDPTRNIPASGNYTIAVCLDGNAGATDAFEATVIWSGGVAQAPELPNVGDMLDDNPDFNQSSGPLGSGSNWSCAAFGASDYWPAGDNVVTAGVTDAHIACYNKQFVAGELTANPGLLATITMQVLGAGNESFQFTTNGSSSVNSPAGNNVICGNFGPPTMSFPCAGATVMQLPSWHLPWPDTQSWLHYTRTHAWNDVERCKNYRDFLACSSLDFQRHPFDCPAVGDGAQYDSPIHPVAKGEVIESAPLIGRLVVDHSNWGWPGWQSVYEHVKIDPPDKFSDGALVNVGDVLGYASCLGKPPTGAHLHLSISYGGSCTTGSVSCTYFPLAAISFCDWVVGSDSSLTRRGIRHAWEDGAAINCGDGTVTPIQQQQTLFANDQTVDIPFAVVVDQAKYSGFASLNGSSVDVSFSGPGPTTIDASTIASDVTHVSGGTYDLFMLTGLAPGPWVMHTHGTGIPPGGEIVFISLGSCAQVAGDAAGDPCVADDDGDGLTDAAEIITHGTVPLNSDSDADSVPDGFEVVHLCTNPLVADGSADSDSDGATNSDEFLQRSDPCLPDSDTDGVSDGSLGSAGPPAVAAGPDNCPLAPNPGQENTSHSIDNGPGISGDDISVPNGHPSGDACSPDGDGDGLSTANETSATSCGPFDLSTTTHPKPVGGDITDADGTGPSWDTDSDGVLDGVECVLGHNPRNEFDKPTPLECANFVQITPGVGPNAAMTDADGDGLTAAAEYCKWGTSDTNVDSDGDGKKDCVEANDTNGDGVQNFPGDTINSAKATNRIIDKTMDFDLNGDGFVNFPGDTILSAKMVNHVGGICPL